MSVPGDRVYRALAVRAGWGRVGHGRRRARAEHRLRTLVAGSVTCHRGVVERRGSYAYNSSRFLGSSFFSFFVL